MMADDDELTRILDEGRRKNAEQRARNLAKAVADAAARGKEPFDLDALERLCDTSQDGRVDPREARQERYEHLYYVQHPEIMTLSELAALITRLANH